MSNISPTPITPVILCGGSGTRLWPLSRQSVPKQFVPLIDGKNLLQLCLERVQGFTHPPLLVGAEMHRFMMSEACAKVAGKIILEPAPRNTAAAMALVALYQPDTMLLFCPADQHIPDVSLFQHTITQGLAAAHAGYIVTFGITPSFPSTAYGYILQGDALDNNAYQVARFIEKPSASSAQRLLLAGGVLWNAGIFLCRASVLLNAFRTHAADILTACEAAMCQAKYERTLSGHLFIRPHAPSFCSCRAQSIDYAVLEHYAQVAVVPFRGQWSDVGSWNSVAALHLPDAAGNRLYGQGTTLLARNTFIYAPQRRVVALGTENMLIIDTPDATLVASTDLAEEVKQVVQLLKDTPQALTHRKVARPWGWYDLLDSGEGFAVKRISINPQASISLQKHTQRTEHWVVVKGTAEVTREDSTFLLEENQSTYIPIGAVHRLRNPKDTPLEIIEIQAGDYLGEDDIVRLEDAYGRMEPIS